MPCSCATAKRAPSTVIAVAAAPKDVTAHEVLPGESCIFCAEKHTSVAYTLLLSGGDISAVIGELELARRHTSVEYKDISSALAEAEYAVCTRDTEKAIQLIRELLPNIESTAMSTDPDISQRQVPLYANTKHIDTCNVLIGEVHLCAAYRLAFEVGYMVPNRQMIIGDLALAREHLARYDYGLNTQLRELRHRVQTTKAADVNIFWTYVCGSLDGLIRTRLAEFKAEYAPGLARWLGVALT